MKQVIPFERDIHFRTHISQITNISCEPVVNMSSDNLLSGVVNVVGDYKLTKYSEIANQFSHQLPVDIAINDDYILDNLNVYIEDFTYKIINHDILRVNAILVLDGLEKKAEQPVIRHEELQEELPKEDIMEEKFMEPKMEEKFMEPKMEEKFMEPEMEEKEIEIPKPQEPEFFKPEELEDPEEEIELPKPDIPLVEEKEKKYMVEEEKIEVEEESEIDIFDCISSSVKEEYDTFLIYIVREGDTLDNILNYYKVSYKVLNKYNDISNIQIGDKLIIPKSKCKISN